MFPRAQGLRGAWVVASMGFGHRSLFLKLDFVCADRAYRNVIKLREIPAGGEPLLRCRLGLRVGGGQPHVRRISRAAPKSLALVSCDHSCVGYCSRLPCSINLRHSSPTVSY